MDALAPFRIPPSALQADEASFEWDPGPEFFAAIDDQHPAPNGQFHVDLLMERTGGVVTLEFTITGNVTELCDRCNAPIRIPVQESYEIIVKHGNPADSTDEVIYIDPETPGLKVEKIVYDFILLSIPIRHRIADCDQLDPAPCDQTILQYLQNNPPLESGNETSSLWDDLKKVIDN